MWKFYRHLGWLALTEFWGATDKALAATAVILFFFGLFNRQFVDAIVTAWGGISPWWSLLPIGLFGTYRLLRANYEEFAVLEKRLHNTEQSLRTKHAEEDIQERLGELYAGGAELRTEKTHFGDRIRCMV